MKYITAQWPAPDNIRAYTTTKQSGWKGRKADNSTTLTELFNLPAEPIWLQQTHTAIVVEACEPNLETNADASYTTHSKQICAVLTADCLPILICNEQGTQVAAIHAGWRGLANGIIEATLKTLSGPVSDLMVWLGPAIGPERFEVGLDVYTAFTQKNPAAGLAFVPCAENKWLGDLYALAALRLQSAGVDKIYGGEYCTYKQEDLFFSYRRDKGQTGRMASLIWMEA